ncbi:MAG: phytoene/squalene synthase family protein [Verrucomicrobia bacterium]|nr:phytoene/squalene synthase family protein [Verrucomicrobiota bacterium]
MGRSVLPELGASYLAAQAVTREHARTFYFASHVLSRPVRNDAYAVYACCRSIDDAVDRVTARGERVRPEVTGEILARAFGEGGKDAGEEWMPAFRDTVRRKDIQRRWFEDLALGVAGDAGPVDLQTWKELELYCYRVAGTVGLMMMRVLGSEDPAAEPRALDLGRGMQLTNILRDVAEDARAGRIYLPASEREQFGIRKEDLLEGRPSGRWVEFMRLQVARARKQYAFSEPGIEMLPAGGPRLSAWLMRELYAGILDPIEASGYDIFSRRHALSLGQKIMRGLSVWWRRSAVRRTPPGDF